MNNYTILNKDFDAVVDREITLDSDVSNLYGSFFKVPVTPPSPVFVDYASSGGVLTIEHNGIKIVSTPSLSVENKRALELHRAWMSEPDDLGDDWWEEFESELQANRLSFHGG